MFIYVLQTTPESDPNFGKIPYFRYKKRFLLLHGCLLMGNSWQYSWQDFETVKIEDPLNVVTVNPIRLPSFTMMFCQIW